MIWLYYNKKTKLWYQLTILLIGTLILMNVSIKNPLAEDTTEILCVCSCGENGVNLQMHLRDLGYFNYKVTGYYGEGKSVNVIVVYTGKS